MSVRPSNPPIRSLFVHPSPSFVITVHNKLNHALTLTPTQKLIKRTVFQDHTQLPMARQETLLEGLAEQAEAGFAKAEEEWEKSVVAFGACLFSLFIFFFLGLVSG